jgi:hypothetical protein
MEDYKILQDALLPFVVAIAERKIHQKQIMGMYPLRCTRADIVNELRPIVDRVIDRAASVGGYRLGKDINKNPMLIYDVVDDEEPCRKSSGVYGHR